MNCEQALELLSAKLDDQLTEAEARSLEAHLKTCPDCRALLQVLETQEEDLHTLAFEAPETLVADVMAQVRQEPRKAAKKPNRWAGFAAVAAVAALLALAAFGVIPLPGLSGDDRAAATVGSIFDKATYQGFGPREYAAAQTLCEGEDAAVLVLWNCEAPPELADLTPETLDDGAACYPVAPETEAAMAAAYRGSHVLREYLPEASPRAAYVILISE